MLRQDFEALDIDNRIMNLKLILLSMTDLKLILLPLFVLALLIPVIVALVMIPNRLGRTPWQRNLQRLFGVVAGIGLLAAIVSYSDKYPDRISFDASIHIAFACVILGIPIATALAGLVTRFLSNRRSE